MRPHPEASARDHAIARRDAEGVPVISPVLRAMFLAYLRSYFPRSFTALRVSHAGPPPRTDAPLIIYSNHASWWDPLVFLLLGVSEFPGRDVYGPMDAAALERYAMFRRLGVFGVERGSRRGAATFLRTSRAILARRGASLWLTPQGEFRDARLRPIELRPGLGHLMRHAGGACVVPLALEYTFWNERRPEVLARFGEPFRVTDEPPCSADGWTRRLAARLEETLDRLAEEARLREPSRFRVAVRGGSGVGWVYDHWRALRARLAGRSFHPGHDPARDLS